MEILSKDTLELLREEKFLHAVHELLRADTPEHSRTIDVKLGGEKHEQGRVTVRRLDP